MYFVFTEIIFPLVLSLLILIPAGLAGLFVIQKVLKIKLERNLLISLSTVLGYAIVAGLVVAVTTLKIFSIWFFGFLFLLVLLFNRKELAKAFIEFKKVFLALSSWKKTDLFLLFGIGIFFLFYLLTALSPPFQCDELAYHIPESIKIIQEGIFSLGGVLDICGNYPLLMESLYGLLFKIGGYSLVHLIHYQIVLATLLGLYAVGSKKFSRRAGLLFVLLCFTLYEFFMNSVSGYIDAASACFEILAVLIFLDININNKADRNKLVLSGILFGVALSIKSTVLYSLLAILIIGFLKFLKSENKKQVLAMFFWFIASFVLVGCFWYLKTWIMAGNPLYPFLGEGSQSQDIVPTLAVQGRGGLQLFGEGVLRVFKTPLQFLEPYYILSFLAFLTLPFLVFVKKEKKWIVSLLFFVLVYFSLWGLTTNPLTKRYLSSGLVFLFVFPVALFDRFWIKLKAIFTFQYFKLIFVTGFLVVLVTASWVVLKHKNNHFFEVKKTEVNYLLGIYNKQEFYNRRGNLGGVYQIADFFNKNYINTQIIMNWGGWQLFLDNDNKFKALTTKDIGHLEMGSWNSVYLFLKENGLTFLAIDEYNKKRDLEMAQGETLIRMEKIVLIENEIIKHSNLILMDNGALIYKINFECEK